MKMKAPARNKVKRPATLHKETLAWIVGDLRRRVEDARCNAKMAGKLGWWPTAMASEAEFKAFLRAANELERADEFPVLR